MAMADSTVAYQEIPGFPNYRVGNDGSVWSKFAAHHQPTFPWRKLKPGLHREGYLLIVLIDPSGRHRSFRVHRLVLLAFVGPCPDGMEGCHNDGNRVNNKLGNLRWDTRAGNNNDKYAHGTDRRGEKTPGAKLTSDAIREIRRRRTNGESLKSLANEFGVGKPCICAIVKRRAWSHVE